MGKFRASCLLFSAYAVRRVVAMAQTWSDIERESNCTTSHCVARGIDSRSFGNRNCRGLFYPLCGKRKGICRRFAPYADSVRRSRIRPQCDGASAYVSGVYGAVDNLAPSQCLFYPALGRQSHVVAGFQLHRGHGNQIQFLSSQLHQRAENMAPAQQEGLLIKKFRLFGFFYLLCRLLKE